MIVDCDPASPSHYARWKIEPLDFIMANDLPFWLGNVIKYAMRYDVKGGVEDLRKARTYLDRKIEELGGPPDRNGTAVERAQRLREQQLKHFTETQEQPGGVGGARNPTAISKPHNT